MNRSHQASNSSHTLTLLGHRKEGKEEVEVELEKRVGGEDWCNCGDCRVEEREVDCLCCQGELAISEEKFNGKSNFR